MENTFFLQFFWTNFIPFSSSTRPKQSCVTCHIFWLFYFWTGTPGRWPGMFLVIVWTLTNHNFNDFAPLSRNQNHIFRCHTVTDSTDLRRSPQIGLHGGGWVGTKQWCVVGLERNPTIMTTYILVGARILWLSAILRKLELNTILDSWLLKALKWKSARPCFHPLAPPIFWYLLGLDWE